MDIIAIGSIVVGGLLPVVTSLLKRWTSVSEVNQKTMALITLGLAFVVTSIYELFTNGFDMGKYFANLGMIYTMSQGIYWAAYKDSGVEKRLEGTK